MPKPNVLVSKGFFAQFTGERFLTPMSNPYMGVEVRNGREGYTAVFADEAGGRGVRMLLENMRSKGSFTGEGSTTQCAGKRFVGSHMLAQKSFVGKKGVAVHTRFIGYVSGM